MSDLRQVINERNIKRSGYGSGAFEPDNFETARRTVNRQGRIEVRVGILSRERSRSPVSSRNIERRKSSDWVFRNRDSQERSRSSSDGRGRRRTSDSPAGRRPPSDWRPASPLPYQRPGAGEGEGKARGDKKDAEAVQKPSINAKEASEVLDSTQLDAISEGDSVGEEAAKLPESVEQDLEAVSDGSVGGGEATGFGDSDLFSDAEMKDSFVMQEDDGGLDQISNSDMVSAHSKQDDNVSLGSLESVGVDGAHPLQTSDISADEGEFGEDLDAQQLPAEESRSSNVSHVESNYKCPVSKSVSNLRPDTGLVFNKDDSPRDARGLTHIDALGRRENRRSRDKTLKLESLDYRERRDHRGEHEELRGDEVREHRDTRDDFVHGSSGESGSTRRQYRDRLQPFDEKESGGYSFNKRSLPRRGRSETSPDGYSRSRREQPPNPPPARGESKTRTKKPCLICQGTDHIAKGARCHATCKDPDKVIRVKGSSKGFRRGGKYVWFGVL